MAKKSVLYALRLINGQSLAASFNSNPFRIKDVDNVALNVSTSGITDNTGTIEVQHRIVVDRGAADPVEYSDWATLTLDPPFQLADTDVTDLINLNQVPPGQIRLVYTAAGGTPDGAVSVWVSACQLGG